AFVGAKVNQKWDTKKVQLILVILLIIEDCFIVYLMITNPCADLTNELKGLTGWKLAVFIAFDFKLGMLMSMGLGNYATYLIFFS
ncbi:sodium:solute symporter, partial [Streptococcus suis]